MVADGLLTRKRYREVPPRVDYELTERSRDLMPVLGALARWGYEWIWSEPREGEAVDIGAILRLAPGLLSPPRSLSGDVELVATAKDAAPRTYVLTADRGRVSISEGDRPEAKAHVTGPHDAWVAAFSPEGSRDGLMVTGDRPLADALLDGLSAAVARISAAA